MKSIFERSHVPNKKTDRFDFEMKFAKALITTDLPRVSSIIRGIEKQAALGSPDSEYLLTIAHVMREKIASDVAHLLKQARSPLS